jgi:3-deoxy-D-manno-octulosonic-acid transferase
LIRFLTIILTAPLWLWVLAQWAARRISAETARNRLGFTSHTKSSRRVVWVHAASLGELTAVRPFLVYLNDQFANYQLLITTNNPSALDVARSWPNLPAILQTAPLDLLGPTRRFLRSWEPCAFINVEAEIWPNRFAALRAKHIPSVMLNARLSEKSLKRLIWFKPAAFNLNTFSFVFTQNAASAENFAAIGVPKDKMALIPNFKSLVVLPKTDATLAERFVRSKTILAASTHFGEDEPILAAFAALHAADPELNLILTPRHAVRATQVHAVALKYGLATAYLHTPDSAASVHIVDTLGELQKLYGLAAVTFVGGSLVPDIGGHTPYEPARAGAAIVTGAFHSNFSAEYSALKDANGCLEATADTLVQTLERALKDAETLAQNAVDCLAPVQDPTALFAVVASKLGLRP